MHFVSIFTTSAEVFIRCAVILAHSNFPFAYNSVTKRTKYATNCFKKQFVSIFTASAEEIYTLSCNFPRWNYDLRTTSSQKNEVAQNYTLRRDSAHSNFYFAYNFVSKGTKDATNC